MPVIQISKIQVRRGLKSELPVSLSEGELGLSLNDGKLYIGAPNFAPIANRTLFPFKNIQVLTEFSLKGLIEESLKYSYRYQDPDHPLFPGPSSFRSTQGLVVERILQEKLDETVSVKDYGAKGNGVDDDTAAIRNAVSDIYNPETGRFRMLYFPAGTYIISSPLILMPFSTWIGDGIGKTIISLKPGFIQTGLTLDPATDFLPSGVPAFSVYTIAGTAGDFSRPDLFPFDLEPGTQIFSTEVIGQEWKTITSAFETVVETADSDENTGANINDFDNPSLATNALPENIFVSGITFSRDSIGDIVRLNRASNTNFENCRFEATWNCSDFEDILRFGVPSTSSDYDQERDGICVRIDSLSTLPNAIAGSKNFTFQNCEFYGNTYGFFVTDSIENTNVISASFKNMFKGVTLGEGVLFAEDLGGELTIPSVYDSTTKFGPIGFRVVYSVFDTIFSTPFSVYTSNPGNLSAFNRYTNYGYGCQAEWDPKQNDVFFGLPPNFDSPNPPRPANTIWSREINAGVFFYADLNDGLFTYDNMSSGDTFDYDGGIPDLRVRNLSNFNAQMNTQDDYHIPYGVTLGDITYLPMDHRTLELPLGENDFRTGIIFDTQEPQRANSVIIDYSISRGIGMRKGQINIVSDGLEINWYENITDIGDDVDITFAVISTTTAKFRVKFTDDRYANPGAVPGGADPIYLRWTARYWDHSFIGYGTFFAPADGESDDFGTSGTEDWGLVTEILDQPDADYDLVPNAVTEEVSYGTLF